MGQLKKFYDFNKNGLNFVILTFLFSIFTFHIANNSNLKVSKILYFSSGILFLGSSIYSFCYILNQYKENKA